MKKGFALLRYLLLAAVFIVTASYIKLRFQETSAAGTTTKDQVLEQVIVSGLNSGHFKPQEIDDEFSKKVFKLYLERIDFNKRFFVKEDIDKLKKYETKIDDDIRGNSLDFFNLSTDLIKQRTKESESLYKEILSSPFDFTQDETVELDPDKLSYPEDKAAQKEAWRKYLKYQTLVRLNEMVEAQERAKEKKDTVVETKTMEQMEADARKQVMKSYDELFKRFEQLDHDDRFALFLNTIANTYDPHTEYFPPKEKKNFDIAMSGRLEGIGATLMEKDDYIKVSAIVPGSASWKQGQLKPGDVIMKVAQGNGEPVDVVGMRLDDAVELIRGKKGTEVRLTVKKADGSIVVIPIIRDVVIIEETYAQSAVVKDDKELVGYIKLPGFYADFGRNGGRNSSDDIKKELEKLKAEGAKGIVLDLRDNGGGSLQDVVEMMGYFIDRGPVVQVKNQTGAPNIFHDRDDGIIWDGPLVVMVNANSASASEILAAAVQDYKRGVVIGTSSTFGKGTVQRFIELDDYIDPAYSNLKPLGSLKITTEKFYRINGNSTQLKGVTPDVLLPDPFSYVERGEKELDYPLSFDETTPAKYTAWKMPVDLEKLKKSSKERVANNEWFNQVSKAAKIMEERSKKTTYTLNLDKFREEQRKLKADARKLETPEKETGIEVKALKLDLEAAAGDTSKAARVEAWFKKLKQDVYLQEAMNVISDMSAKK